MSGIGTIMPPLPIGMEQQNGDQLQGTPGLVDFLNAKYREAIDAENHAGRGPRRDAQAELNAAAHFIVFAKNWLAMHHVVRTYPSDLNVAVQFDTMEVVRVTDRPAVPDADSVYGGAQRQNNRDWVQM